MGILRLSDFRGEKGRLRGRQDTVQLREVETRENRGLQIDIPYKW